MNLPPILFERLVGLDLSTSDMTSTLQLIAEASVDAVPGALQASVTLVDPGAASTVVSTGQLATALDESQYDAGHGPCLEAATGGQVRYVTDARAETRWPQFAERARDAGLLSTLSTPVPVANGLAAVNVYGAEADAFTPADQENLRVIAGYAAVALTNRRTYDSAQDLAAQMQEAMRSRALIDQAKGIVMAQHVCGPDEAFDILARASQKANKKLRDVAEELVRKTSEG